MDVPLDGISYRSILGEPWLAKADLEIAAAFGRTQPGGYGPIEFVLAASKLLSIGAVKQLRNLLDVHWNALKAFVSEYRSLRTSPPQGPEFPRGISLAHLVIMLLASRGEAEFSKALSELKATPGRSDVATIVGVARRAMGQSSQK